MNTEILTTFDNLAMKEEEKQHLINEENFQRLRQLQQDIYKATELSPSVRKLINLLITEENLQQLKSFLLVNGQLTTPRPI
ncbi:MAG: hypothetical protein K0S11_1758 [Gammaproteobacteria bacterium]|jgi:hypothetical protein|nr:hypothetical protein [Gammaproteobacteria bacterium]